MSCSMRWRGKNCSKMGHERLRQSLSSLGSCVILKGMRSLLSTYQMMVFFLVCQIRSSSSTYLSGIARKGCHYHDTSCELDGWGYRMKECRRPWGWDGVWLTHDPTFTCNS